MTKIAYFDIDGVLANDAHRVHFALKRDWANYFREDRMAQDLVWDEGLQMVRDMEADGWEIRYLTGRRIDRYDVTKNWLIEIGFPFAPSTGDIQRLRMRSWAEISRLAEYKTEVIRRVIDTERPERLVLFEDDPEVVALVQETFGPTYAQLTPWYVKEKALVKKATA